jgi:hypothetical protein
MNLERITGRTTHYQNTASEGSIVETPPDKTPVDSSNLQHSNSLLGKIPSKKDILAAVGLTLIAAKTIHTDGKVDKLTDEMAKMQERQGHTEETVKEILSQIGDKGGTTAAQSNLNVDSGSDLYVVPPTVKNFDKEEINATISAPKIAKMVINSSSKPKFNNELLSKLRSSFNTMFKNPNNPEHIKSLADIGLYVCDGDGNYDAKAQIAYGVMEGIANLENTSGLQNIINVGLNGYNKSVPGFGGTGNQWIVNVNVLKATFKAIISEEGMPEHIRYLAKIGADTAGSEGYAESRAKICHGIMEGITKIKNESVLQNIADVTLNGYIQSPPGIFTTGEQSIVNVSSLRTAFVLIKYLENLPDDIKFSAQLGIDISGNEELSPDSRAKECYKIMESIRNS